MKKQYEAKWNDISGSQHELWPIYAESKDKAMQQFIDFINYYKKTRYIDMKSVRIAKT